MWCLIQSQAAATSPSITQISLTFKGAARPANTLQICPPCSQQPFPPSHPKETLNMTCSYSGFFCWIISYDQTSASEASTNSASWGYPAQLSPVCTALLSCGCAPRRFVLSLMTREQRLLLPQLRVWRAACFTWIKQLLTLSQKGFGLCLLQE